MRRISRYLALCLLLAGPAAGDVPGRLEAEFRDWIEETGVETGVMTVWRKGEWQRDVAIGMPADAPVELASLSKAVTAICAAHMVIAGDWKTDTTSREVLGFGPPGLAVGQFMTHSAGLGPDETQGAMPRWLDRRMDRSEVAARHAMDRKTQNSEPGRFAYNNENYAVLGAMIAQRTGEPYTDYCQRIVSDRSGVTTLEPSPRTGAMASWGGWQMSVQDYARMMNWAYGSPGYLVRHEDWPSADMGGGAFYGVGMVHRDFRDSTNYWHFGLLCFPERLNAGAYGVIWMQDWSVVVAYDKCVDWDAMVALDNALARAVFQ